MTGQGLKAGCLALCPIEGPPYMDMQAVCQGLQEAVPTLHTSSYSPGSPGARQGPVCLHGGFVSRMSARASHECISGIHATSAGIFFIMTSAG